jgi:cytidylate kinase
MASAGAVAVGRDCGTVVFPHAPVKFFLPASPHVRALRRAAQLRTAGTIVEAEQLEAEIAGRDALDTQRAVSPLRPAEDAHIIDTGSLDIDDMVAESLRVVRQAGLRVGARE